MPIQIIHKSGLACPFLVCDECGKPITAHPEAIVVWHDDTRPEPRFLHKGDCDRNYSEVRGRGYWEGLGNWLVMLCHNAGLRSGDDFDVIREEQEELAGLGL